MSNLFETAATWLGQQLQTAGGRSVSYQRGAGTPVELTATPQQVTYQVPTGDGGLTLVEAWDWTITASELGFDPVEGDEITETLNSVERIYETLSIGDKPCFEWLDTAGILIVVHTKRVD